ncbi:hypothetical protein Bca101_068006 [Brassica carinata]
MKLIPLMCIASVMILTSFPATIKSDCVKTIESCMRQEPKNSQWKTKCCTMWSGIVTPKTLACACRVKKNHFNNSFLNRILDVCKLGSTEQFKC